MEYDPLGTGYGNIPSSLSNYFLARSGFFAVVGLPLLYAIGIVHLPANTKRPPVVTVGHVDPRNTIMGGLVFAARNWAFVIGALHFTGNRRYQP